MNKQKRKQKNNGITLIALVLTIIVLLILAAVVISLALGDNGLLFRAKRSKQDQQIAQEKDKIIAGYEQLLQITKENTKITYLKQS